MSKQIRFLGSFLLLFVLCSFVYAADNAPKVSPTEALQRLKEGNSRFVAEQSTRPNSKLSRLKQTADEGQHPTATILGCSDSRVPHELLFDQGFGDIFSVRVAGNVCSNNEMGSIEYAVEHLHTPLLVVLGHTKCGAVTATVQHGHVEGHVKYLVDKIAPAAEHAKKTNPDLPIDKLVEAAIEENVHLVVETLLKESEIVRKAVELRELLIVPAIYDIATGKVEWLETPNVVNQGWESLFNGKDLSGWSIACQPQDAEKIFWTVKDGAIFCDSIGRKDHNYMWLLSDKEFQDFELRLKFKAYPDSPGNSGLQFRSRYDKNNNGGWLDGPQVDIHPPKSMSWRTGLIYDETRGENRWVFPSLKDAGMPERFAPEKHIMKYTTADNDDNWNELTLICKGTQVKTIVNGIVRTDWDAKGIFDNEAHQKRNVGQKGHFALQLHSGDELRIQYKDIQIRELNAN